MKKSLGVWNIVWINLTVIIGLRWLPMAAAYGASALAFWLIAVVLFFIPLSFVATELATTWPEQGGMYVWVREAFGEKPAFLTAWFYWVNSFTYGPTLLTFIAVCIAYTFDPALAHNKYYIAAVVLFGYWGIMLFNLRGISKNKFLPDLAGSVGTIFPGLLIIGLGFASAFIWHYHIPTDYSWKNWIPNFSSESNLAFLMMLMFSMAGIELSPTFAGETKDPRKTFLRATVISSIIIALIYIIGTIALNFLVAPDKITVTTGLLDALQTISNQLNLPFIMVIFALTLALGNIGGVSVWTLAPIVMFFESIKDGILPKQFTKLNKNGLPATAMLTQAAIITVVTLTALALLPTVNIFYETLALLSTIVYFLPYLFMFAAFVHLRKTHPHVTRPYRVPGGIVTAHIIAYLGLFSVVIAMLFSFLMPPSDVINSHSILTYRLEILLTPIAFWLIALGLYSRHQRKRAKKAAYLL